MYWFLGYSNKHMIQTQVPRKVLSVFLFLLHLVCSDPFVTMVALLFPSGWNFFCDFPLQKWYKSHNIEYHCIISRDMYSFHNLSNITVIGRILGPKDIHVLIVRNYECVMSHGIGKLRLQMELLLPTSRPWDREVTLSCLCGPTAIPRVLVSERGRQEGQVRVIERVRDATLLALTTEEGAVSQKIQAPSRSWKS